MSIKALTYYTVVCDRCGGSADEDSDYSAWATQSTAQETATDAEYIKTATEDLCPGCTKGWVICAECRVEAVPTDDEARAAGFVLDDEEWFGPKCAPGVNVDQAALEVQP